MKNKYLAILLALVSIFTFGLLPLHCFYLNRSFKGVLFIVGFWTMIPTVWSICDLIRLCLMSPAELQNYSGLYTSAPIQQNVIVNITREGVGTDV